MAYEVLVKAWRPLTVPELLGAMREHCAATLQPKELTKPGEFSYVDVARPSL